MLAVANGEATLRLTHNVIPETVRSSPSIRLRESNPTISTSVLTKRFERLLPVALNKEGLAINRLQRALQ
jgi:hypothetical protein